YSLMRCSLTSRADSYPDQMFEALALLGRELEAVRLAELLTDAGRKVRTLTRIGVLVAEQSGSPEAGLPVLTRALEVARAAHDDGLAEGVPLLIGVADGL